MFFVLVGWLFFTQKQNIPDSVFQDELVHKNLQLAAASQLGRGCQLHPNPKQQFRALLPDEKLLENF